VLCHADLHTWNVLVDSVGDLWIADWDEAVLAPRERDLMFVVGGIGHGLVTPAATAAGDANRRAAVEGFEQLFAPGNIVDLA
jgi:Ser/Thr protein kinase RdoA (MazF antagonist)